MARKTRRTKKSPAPQAQAVLIKAIRRPLPKPGQVIQTAKKVYRRPRIKADAKRQLAELDG